MVLLFRLLIGQHQGAAVRVHQRHQQQIDLAQSLAQIEVEIADGVRVRQVRSMVSGVRAKGEPVKDEGGSS